MKLEEGLQNEIMTSQVIFSTMIHVQYTLKLVHLQLITSVSNLLPKSNTCTV